MNNEYNKKLKQFARNNRKEGTKAEIKLWCELLRNKQMMGYSFLRQRAIANYIADFFSKDLKLLIEVDGLTHSWEGRVASDNKRDEALLELGYKTLRFANNEVMQDMENVKRTIESFIIDFEKSHPPTPLRRGTQIAENDEQKILISSNNSFAWLTILPTK
ncbi:DUF559 domain-containing protein [uncultured Pedobacter sp.]|nr:DUF559 domain-containing protein [uncultured Pedobacter sp.]